MKKKIFSILFALVLVLSLSLVTAVPVGAQETLHVVPFELQTWGTGQAEWSTDKPHTGSYSAKLTMPSGDSWDNMAAVKVSHGEALSTIANADFKYWYWQEATGSLYGVLYIDSGGGDVVDRLLVSVRAANNTATSTWTETAQVDQWTEVGYDPETKLFTTPTHGTTWGTLAEWQTTYSDATLLYAAAAWGYFGDRVVYIDDISINGVTYYGLIQDAINSATSTTILVADGIYTEDLTVDTANLTLKSENGSGSTTIKGVDGYVIELNSGATNFKLGGADGHGFTVIGNATASTVLLETIGAPSGVEISYNAFDMSGNPSIAIAVGSGGADDLTISYNAFSITTGHTAIYFDCHPITDLLIDTNTFTGPSSGVAAWVNWVPDAGADGAMISNNIVTNAHSPIRMENRTKALNNVTYTGNTIVNGDISIGPHGTNADLITSLAITENSFTGPTYHDVFFEILGSVAATCIDYGTLTVARNNFVGAPSGEFAVINGIGGTTLDAECNYWGNASGPTHSGNPGGTGGAIREESTDGDVDYIPWLLMEGGSCFDFDQAQVLQVGWTLVSTDNAIDTALTSWEGVTLAYRYTADGFEEIATVADLEPDDLVPVNALYLKTVGGGGIAITYSGGVPVASSKGLEAGWNLISSATDDNAKAVLSPLRYVQVGDEQGVGLATLVSQGNYNRNTSSFYLATLTDTDWTKLASATFNLSPFDGYWVYMNAAKVFGVVPN